MSSISASSPGYLPVLGQAVAELPSQAPGAWELPGYGKMAVLHDPDGNRVGLWQH